MAGRLDWAAVQLLVEVIGDGTGDLAQVGGLAEQLGQLAQRPGWELVQGAGHVDLGRIVQQDQDQVAVPTAPTVQPGATAPSGLLII